MIITNKYNLPEQMVTFVENQTSYEQKPDRIGVTSLIGPPLIRTLKLEHFDKITIDVVDYIWLALGIGFDRLMTASVTGAAESQTKLELPFDKYGLTLVGVPDLIKDDLIADWKVTSVWAFMDGIKPDWIAQLNCYAYMYETLRKRESWDKPPNRFLKIYAILRDWQRGKAVQPDYPLISFFQRFITNWGLTEQHKYVTMRMGDHVNNPRRECTPEEKWQKQDTWAVMKEGRKSAMRVLESEPDAKDWLGKQKKTAGLSIVKRPGMCVRCESYCNVNQFCSYYKENK